MKTKTIKRSLIACFVLMFFAFSIAAGAMFAYADPSGFAMQDGARVRVLVDENDGFSFTTTMSAETYGSVSDDAGFESGIIILPTDLIPEGTTLSLSTPKIAIGNTTNLWKKNGDVYESKAYLYGFGYENYDRPVSVVGYYDSDELAKPIYTAYDESKNSISMKDVAERALELSYDDAEVDFEYVSAVGRYMKNRSEDFAKIAFESEEAVFGNLGAQAENATLSVADGKLNIATAEGGNAKVAFDFYNVDAGTYTLTLDLTADSMNNLAPVCDEVVLGDSAYVQSAGVSQTVLTVSEFKEKLTISIVDNGSTANNIVVDNIALETFADEAFSVETESLKIASAKSVAGNTNENNTETIEYTAVDGVKFFTGDASVATVSESGVVTAGSYGNTDVTALYGGNTYTVSVSVKTAITDKNDLDEIALCWAKNNDPTLWRGDYLLANDIDYKGKQIIPIAPYANSGWDSTCWANSEYFGEGWKNTGRLNHESNPGTFSGTMDGNGYAIKNALFAANVMLLSNGSLLSGFIGGLKGTLKDIAFIDTVFENPKEVTNWADDKAFDVSKTAWTKGSGVVGRVLSGGVVENVYIELTTGMHVENGSCGAIAYIVETGASVENCIAIINKPANTYYYNAIGNGPFAYMGMFGYDDKSASVSFEPIQNCFLINAYSLSSCHFITGTNANYTTYDTGRVYTSYASLNAAQASVLATYGGAWSYEGGVLKLGNNIVG